MRLPWSFAMISTLPFWKTPTHEYVVPKSIPMTVPRSSWATAAVASAAAASAVRIIFFLLLLLWVRVCLWGLCVIATRGGGVKWVYVTAGRRRVRAERAHQCMQRQRAGGFEAPRRRTAAQCTNQVCAATAVPCGPIIDPRSGCHASTRVRLCAASAGEGVLAGLDAALYGF
mmetsp:Transcript_10340/g.27386  ORF Transcript_10340/g.27386 Transcript_10340/m.27386 type:complete len:172 (-) Transcript_10340:67-582(-)